MKPEDLKSLQGNLQEAAWHFQTAEEDLSLAENLSESILVLDARQAVLAGQSRLIIACDLVDRWVGE